MEAGAQRYIFASRVALPVAVGPSMAYVQRLDCQCSAIRVTMMNYAARRQQLFNELQDAVLVLPTSAEAIRSHDSHYDYRPASDVLWLTGFAEPDAIVVLAPGHTHPFTLFVRPRNRDMEIWNGRRAGPEGAMAQFGADAAWPISEFDQRIGDYLQGRARLFYSLGVDSAMDVRMLRAVQSLRASKRKPDRAPNAIVDPRGLLHRLRMYKSAEELALMATAAEISAQGHLEAMRATRPGMLEYEIQGIIEGHFLRSGARAPAYGSIVAGGRNACILHYVDNRDSLREGDLLLVDAGAEYQWYAGDITRTWPVGARFSGPQRDVYQAVLDAQIASIHECVPGISNDELQRRTIRRLTASMVDLGLLQGEVDGLIEKEAYKRFYMHGVGHYLGLDVHDVGQYWVSESQGLGMAPGMVVTIEPGIYIAEDDEQVPEAFRGIGVRIEDDVVITEGAPRILTSLVPKEIADIEAIRAESLER